MFVRKSGALWYNVLQVMMARRLYMPVSSFLLKCYLQPYSQTSRLRMAKSFIQNDASIEDYYKLLVFLGNHSKPN